MYKARDLDLPSKGIVVAGAGMLLWSAYSVFYNNQVNIYAENGLLESAQAGLLAIACIIYLVRAMLEQRSDKLILVFCSLICLSFLLREMDLEKFDLPSALIFVGSGVGRNAILVAAFLALLGYAVVQRSHYTTAGVQFAKSRPGLLLLAAGVFLWLGDFFETDIFLLRHSVFIEEANELIAYVLILLSSVAAHNQNRNHEKLIQAKYPSAP